jgi:hypothetical protein
VLFLTSYCRIKNYTATVDGTTLFSATPSTFEAFIQALYQYTNTNYPKFYKMDNQSKLAVMAAEVLLQNGLFLQTYAGEEISVVLSNAVASEDADKKYVETIADPENYFPSPALFVYTLPSIMTGEICIKYKIKGENAFFVSDYFNADLLCPYLANLMKYTLTKACIGGWVNYDAPHFEAFMFTVESTPGKYQEPLTNQILHQLYVNDLWTH